MTFLKKEEAMFKTDGDKLASVKVILWGSEERGDKKEIEVIPLLREEIQDLMKSAGENDGEVSEDKSKDLITQHLVKPNFDKGELKHVKPRVLDSITKSLMIASDFPESALVFGFDKSGEKLKTL